MALGCQEDEMERKNYGAGRGCNAGGREMRQGLV